jgi:hypothetical protein
MAMTAQVRAIEDQVYRALLKLDAAIDAAVDGTTLTAPNKVTAKAALKVERDGVRAKRSDQARRVATAVLDPLV